MGFLQTKRRILFLMTLIVLAFALPAATFGQGRGRGQEKKFYKFVNGHDARDGRWNVRGRRITRSYVIYQPSPSYSYRSNTYGYPQSYSGNQYYTYGSSQPYYANRYYSYRYSQPYFANRSTYAWANPTYRYDESWYRRRHQRSGVRIRVRSR